MDGPEQEPEMKVISVPSVSEVRGPFLTFQPSYMLFQYQDPLYVLLDYIEKVSAADLCYIFALRDYVDLTWAVV
jgi:hypothetical protein